MKKINLDNKKTLVLSIVAVLTLILVVIGATYAYFVAQGGSSSQADVSVKTATTDVLILSTGEEINITADQFTFGKDMGNRDGSTYAKAELRANNSTNNAKANYYVYLDIKENSFIYTTENKTAELILTVTDPDGNPVTKVNGLEYVTVNGISGFDVTDKIGLFTIVDNHEIVSTGTKIENWNVVLTLVNLDSDQSQNAGNGLKAVLEITKDAKSKDSTLASLIKSQYTGTQGENNLYLHDSTLENGAGDGSYRYAGSSDTTNNFVCFGSDSSVCPYNNLYRIIGVFDNKIKLISADYATKSLLGTNGDYDDEYVVDAAEREYYKGELSSINTYFWNKQNDTNINNGDGSNEWSTSLLNTVNLNTNYLNNIGAKWSNMIAVTDWQVGGNNSDNIMKTANIKEVYKNEIISPAKSKIFSAKIGLMYASDYGYAASANNWSKSLLGYGAHEGNVDAINNNWMFLGSYDWTITPDIATNDTVFTAAIYGYVAGVTAAMNNTAVRPTFYLDQNVNYKSGDGTKANPYRITD